MACARRVDGVLETTSTPHAAAATITRTPQTHAAVGVALHAEREGHVRQAERVVEAGRARDRVLEVDEVRLGVGEDRLGRGRRRRGHEGRRHGGERERDDELHVNLRAERRSRLPPRGGSREGAARPQRVPPRSGLTASVAVCVRRRPPRPRLQPPASARSVCAVAQLQHAQAELCVAARGGRSWDQPRRAAFERRPPPRPRQSLFFAKNASALARCGLSDATAVASAASGPFFGRPAPAEV